MLWGHLGEPIPFNNSSIDCNFTHSLDIYKLFKKFKENLCIFIFHNSFFFKVYFYLRGRVT